MSLPSPSVPASEQALGDCHADRVAAPLAQRAGRGLDAARMPAFRVACGAAAELPEPLDVFDGHRIAGEIQHGVQQHRAVSVREHKAVAVLPQGVPRVVAHDIAPQHLGDVGHAHGHAGVSGVGALHGVHGECADGVGEFAACSHAGPLNGRWPSRGVQAAKAPREISLAVPGERASLSKTRNFAAAPLVPRPRSGSAHCRGAHCPPVAPVAQITPNPVGTATRCRSPGRTRGRRVGRRR